jgi:hypothetical protein
MASAKNTEVVAAYVKTESTYNTYSSPAATDAIRLHKEAGNDRAIRFGFPGARRYQNLGYGGITRAAPNGRNVTGTLRCEPKGRGAAYSSSAVEVPDTHRLLAAGGYTPTVTTTGGSEKWDFVSTLPTATPTSVSMATYGEGELWPIAGVYTNPRLVIADTGIPVLEFPFVGTMATDPTDATPNPTYTVPTVMPPVATGVTFTLGSFTGGIIRSGTFDSGRSIDNPRLNINGATGHAGFAPGKLEPTFEFLCEMTTLQGSPYHAASAIDPYNLWENATGLAFSLVIGSVQYNRLKLLFGQIQITNVVPERDGPIALWRITGEPSATTDNGTDMVTWRFD